MKRKIVNLTPVICYALQVLAGLVLAIVMYAIGMTDRENNRVLLVLISILFFVIGLTYFFIGIIPLTLRVLSLFNKSRKMIVACMVFDIVYIAVSAIMLACAITAHSVLCSVLFAILALVSGVSLGMNIVSTDKREEMK